MSWGAVAVIGGSLVSGHLSSKAQEKAADRQAQGIENASAISAEAAAKARSDILALFEPAFSDISTSLQQARNDILYGRESAQNILNAAFRASSNQLQTTAQQSLNALFGTPGTPLQSVSEVSTGLVDASGKPLRPDFVGAKPVSSALRRDMTQQIRPETDAILPPTDSRLSGREDLARNVFERGDFSALRNGAITIPQGQVTSDIDAITDIPSGELSGIVRPGEMEVAADVTYQQPSDIGFTGAQSALRQGIDAQQAALLGGRGAGIDALRSGTNAGLSALREAIATGRGDISSARDAGIGYITPYMETGESALRREAALSGALGPEAQAEAYANYQYTPGQMFIQDQQERALRRNQSAIGGLGGGNIRKELQRQAAGNAATFMQQEIDNLRSLRGAGQQAATTGAGLEMTAGQSLADLARTLGVSELQAMQMLGQNIAGIETATGRDLADVYGGGSQALSALRQRVGELASQTIGGTGTAIAAGQQGLGTNLANLDQETALNIARLAEQLGTSTSGLRTNLATILGNLATGQGTQQANLASALGSAQAGGVTNPWGNSLQQLIGIYSENPDVFNFGSGQQ